MAAHVPAATAERQKKRNIHESNEAPDDDVFRVFEEGADSVWLLGTDSSKAIDLLAKVNHVS